VLLMSVTRVPMVIAAVLGLMIMPVADIRLVSRPHVRYYFCALRRR
jgi:hypothetical protein